MIECVSYINESYALKVHQCSYGVEMFQMKCVLFAVVALMTVGGTVAIYGGQDAARAQFPFYAYIEAYKIPDLPVISKDFFMAFNKYSTKFMGISFKRK